MKDKLYFYCSLTINIKLLKLSKHELLLYLYLIKNKIAKIAET